MPAFFLTIRDILLLRRGPQDLPYSTQLLTAVAALCVILQLAVALGRDISVGAVIVGAALWLAFTLGVLSFVLGLRGLRNRFVQSATALLSCTLVFTVISIPIALLAGEPPTVPEQVTSLQILLGLISLPLLIWKILVDAHVFRHSFDIPFLGGVAISLLWIIAAMLLSVVAGAPATGA